MMNKNEAMNFYRMERLLLIMCKKDLLNNEDLEFILNE